MVYDWARGLRPVAQPTLREVVRQLGHEAVFNNRFNSSVRLEHAKMYDEAQRLLEEADSVLLML
jgi:hypothetical protein